MNADTKGGMALRPEPPPRRLIAELLGVLPRGTREEPCASEDIRAKIRKIARRDYARALRTHLSRSEVEEILREGKRGAWPRLNRQPVTLVSPQEFVQQWSALGVEIKFIHLPGKRDLSLLGFYSKEIRGIRRRPLICVNTAHHPAIVGAALDHEMGHHLTVRMFNSGGGVARFLSRTGYEGHLADQAELAADILVSVGIFPGQVARLLLNDGKTRRSKEGMPQLGFTTVLEYIARQYGLHFEPKLRGERKCQALAALIHYTQLRRALLEEYDT